MIPRWRSSAPAEMRFLGLAQLKTEGAQTAFDNAAGERYVYNQEHTEIALGYAITRKAIDDNLYKITVYAVKPWPD